LKKVLIISYYFPPSGGPGVQRILKFVKYLPEYGWEPVVLTVEDGDFPARDESLLNEIPANTKVYRTKIFEPYGFYRKITGRKKSSAIDVDNINKEGKKKISEQVAEFIRATFFIPDARRGWLRYAVREGKKILDTEKPDVIFSSSPPYTCAMIAMKLKRYHFKKYGKQIPWVSDFRDAWTGYLTTPDRWLIPAVIDAGYERNTLEHADALTMVANGIKDDFDAKYPGISKEKEYFLIRNGFDSEDYKGLKYDKSKNEKFTVVYTGSMYGKRNPFFFINTLTGLVKENKADINKIKLIFVGRMGGDIVNYIESSYLKQVIEHIPYVPHSESIKNLLKADAMLLLIDEDKYSKMILSGKVFEYLGASLITGKPVLAIAPESALGGEAADLIRETSSGEIISHNNKEYLSKVFLKYYNSFLESDSTPVLTNAEAIKQYDRKLLTAKLAEVFEKIKKSV
jgi:glycosyltransferase involved in cell wall biosynthesis